MRINKVIDYYYRAYNNAARGRETARSSINTLKGVIGAEQKPIFYSNLKKWLLNLFCGPLYWPNTFPTGVDEAVVNLLYSLTRLIRPKVAVEIGTAKGNAAIAIGQALKDNGHGILYTIDPEDQHLVHIAIRKSGLRKWIKYIVDYSYNIIPKLGLEKFDLVFIDGDHRYEHVLKDFNLIKDLITPGGVIVFHDVNLKHFDGPRRVVEQIRNGSDFDVLELPTLSGESDNKEPVLLPINAENKDAVGVAICRKRGWKEQNEILKRPSFCPVCNFEGVLGEKENFGNSVLYTCPNCSVCFWWPLRHPGEKFYEESYMFEILEERKPAWYHEQFLKHPPIPQGSLLDVGCGQGEFLNAASRRTNFDLWGIDIAKKNVDFIKEKFRLENVYNETLNTFLRRDELPKFDIVTSFEVLEHLHNPKEILGEIKQVMRPGGYLVLSVPNKERFGTIDEDWDYPPNHLFRWNKRSISIFLESHGFSIVTVIEEPFSKEFFFMKGVFSLGLARYIKEKHGETLSQKGGGAPLLRSERTASLVFFKNLAKIKNFLLTPVAFCIAVIMRILGFKYWDMYVVAKLDEKE